MTGDPLEVVVPEGIVRGTVWEGPGPLVLCLPGIAANHRSFDAVAGALGGERRVAAVDLRGRGASPATEPGSYGWVRHAGDALAVAAALERGPVCLVGHSMGAYVAMQAAALAPDAVERIVLIDGAGAPEGAALRSIVSAGRTVGRKFASADAYVAAMRHHGVIEPWSDTWDASLRYDVEPGRRGLRQGVRLRTSRAAVLEDALYGATHDPRDLWSALTVPVLLVRATVPLRPHGGLVVPAGDVDALSFALPRLTAVDVRANHYGVVAHPDTLAAVRSFVGAAGATVAARPDGWGSAAG